MNVGLTLKWFFLINLKGSVRGKEFKITFFKIHNLQFFRHLKQMFDFLLRRVLLLARSEKSDIKFQTP